MSHPDLSPATLAVTAGRPPRVQGGPVNPPIVLSSTYVSAGTPAPGELFYTRNDTETWRGLESALATLEEAEFPALAFASGMAAIAAAFSLVPRGRRVVMPELVCDGVLVATPAGSTAYNLSVQGPILPLDSSLVALTPISPFRPRRWRGAILPDRTRISFRMLDPQKRPVSAVADQREVRDVASVDVTIDRTTSLTLLFDPEHALDDRIAREQFTI